LPFRFFRSAAFLLLAFAAAVDAFVAMFNGMWLGSSAMMSVIALISTTEATPSR